MSDYAIETREEIEERIAALSARAAEAGAEADHARGITGLDNAAKAADAEANRIEAEVADLRQVQERIERGYPYWERQGLEIALEAMGDPWRWDLISESLAPGIIYTPDDVEDVRMPFEVQRAYAAAFESGLFDRFELCSVFETDGIEDVVLTTYYLVGIKDLPTMGAMFAVTHWDTR